MSGFREATWTDRFATMAELTLALVVVMVVVVALLVPD
jgi:Na+/proline symporter